METAVKILFIEDQPADFRLVERHLEKNGLSAECHRVANREELTAALDRQAWDVVLSDYNVPTLNFEETLRLLKPRLSELPLILVSGSVGEERAVELLREGVWDFVLKEKLTRLVPAIQRALSDAAERRARRQAEATLRDSEKKFATIFHNSAAAIGISRLGDGKFLEVNDAFVRLSGYQREEIIGHTSEELQIWPSPERDQVMARLRKQKRLVFEVRGRRQSGELCDVLASVQIVELQGEACIVGSLLDVTDRKQAEAALAQSETRFRQMTACLADVLYGVDGQTGEFSYLSPVFERMLGYTPEEVLFMGGREKFLAGVIQDGAFDPQRELFLAMQKAPSEVSPNWQAWWRCKDGGLKFIEDLSIPVYADGQLQAIYGVLRDITERKRVEAALRQSEEQFRAMFEVASIGMVQTDPLTRKYQRVNRKFCEITGYSAEELLQMTVMDLTHPDDRDREQELFRQVMAGEVPNFHLEKRYVRKGGAMAWVSVNMTPIRDLSGQPLRTMTTVEDITERKRLETQFRQSQKMEAIGTLAGGVAHDFNNILTSILMQIELSVTEGDVSDAVGEGFQRIREDAERAASLTRQLLLFSRRQVMQPRDLDLNEVVTSLAKMLQRIIGEDVHLHLSLHPVPLLTHADPGMLDQVAMNLAVNARDAMPKGGRLMIGTSERVMDAERARQHPEAAPGRYVCLTVEDTGCGISPEVLPKIFEPFFTTKEPGKGTGLGLATVFGIVKQHRGWLTVESQPDQGATFRVYLPALATAATATVAEATPKPRGGTEIILLVEDDAAVRTAMAAVLRRQGYRILEAASGPEALTSWNENPDTVALLLTDLVMPGGLSGRDLAHKLRAEKSGLKVLFTSGYSAEIAGQQLKLGAGENFIQKPCHPADLLRAIRDTLDA
jgi:PAS domain S-box-containing protein